MKKIEIKDMVKIVIVGRGRVGTGLAQALRDVSIDWHLVSGRRLSEGPIGTADVVVVAVSDGAISQCAERLAIWLQTGSCVLHCAGARGPDELAVCRDAGAHVGVMHPLVSFADADHPPSLRGATFVTAGDVPAIEAAQHLARVLGARILVAPIHGPVYHALIALVANGAVGLVHAAVPILQRLGLGRREAEQSIAGLLRTVVENVDQLGVPKALTGPIARGDAASIAAHRGALQRAAPDAAAAYDAIVPLMLRCAIDGGMSSKHAAEIREALGRE